MQELLAYLTASEPSPYHPLSGIREEFSFHLAFNLALTVTIFAVTYYFAFDFDLQPNSDVLLHVQCSRFLPFNRKMQETFSLHTCPV